MENRAVPATFTVNTGLDVVNPADGKLSLREAISRANTTTGADLIVLPAGVLKIATAGAGEDDNLNGDFDIADTVTIRGAGAGLTVIDGQQLDRVFEVIGTAPHSIEAVLQGVTVRNGNSAGNGGGIRVVDADMVVRDCAIIGNRAFGRGGGISANGAADLSLVRTTVARNVARGAGGGLHVEGELTMASGSVRRNTSADFGGGIFAAEATLNNSTVVGNVAGGNGGGLYATNLTLTNSTFSGNRAISNGGGIDATTATLTGGTVSGNTAGRNGGGLWAAAINLARSTVSGNTAGGSGGGFYVMTPTLTNCTISGNTAVAGSGGGFYATGTATLSNCTVDHNTAGLDGGGMNAAGTAELRTCTVSDNTAAAGSGGGIRAGTTTLVNSTVNDNSAALAGGGVIATTAGLGNCTIAGNTAGTEGGGVNANMAVLLHCTIAENIAHVGGGLYHVPGATFSVENTIVALNLVDLGGTGPDVAGEFLATARYNLIGDGTGGSGFDDFSNLVGTAANPIDPRLGALKNYGGPTQTMALLAGSPAIDAGNFQATDPVTGLPLATDQRGFRRKKDGNGDGLAVVDIGAFER